MGVSNILLSNLISTQLITAKYLSAFDFANVFSRSRPGKSSRRSLWPSDAAANAKGSQVARGFDLSDGPLNGHRPRSWVSLRERAVIVSRCRAMTGACND
jgi:hypothetical protein